MKGRYALLSIFLVLIAFQLSSTQSQGAKNNPQQGAQAEQASGPYQEGTDKRPFVVRVLPGPKTEKETKHEAYEQNAKPIYEGIVAWSTFALAIITFFLAIANAFLLRITNQTAQAAKVAAGAAQKSAETLAKIERAYVFVTVEATENDIIPTGTVPNSHVHVRVSNEGKTPAVLMLVQGEVVKRDAYPTKEDVEIATNHIVPGIFIRSGEAKTPPIVFVYEGNEYERLIKREINLICYGRVKYSDVFGKDHETGFCWEFTLGTHHEIFSDAPRTNTFRMSPFNELNYYT